MPLGPPSTLEHSEIESRIPHQGSMCLLDRVTAWNEVNIHCEATGHHAESNPLRAHERLGAACGIEYAAQAMAVHGALIAESQLAPGEKIFPQVGYLASVRGVTLHTDRLDDVEGVLSVHAERTSGDASTILYSFTVSASGAPLLCGRAVVVLNPAGLAQPSDPAT